MVVRKMRTRFDWLQDVVMIAMVFMAVLLAHQACNIELPGTTTVVTTTQTQSGTPEASPSPGTQANLPPGSRIVVADFGEQCSGGLTQATDPNTVRVGCVAILTCTPKLPDGTDAPPALHGPAPAFFGPISGSQNVDFHQWDSNPFNANSKILGGTASAYRCDVGGLSGTLSLTHVP